MREGRREGGKGERREGKKSIYVTLSMNQTESQQKLNMKSDT